MASHYLSKLLLLLNLIMSIAASVERYDEQPDLQNEVGSNLFHNNIENYPVEHATGLDLEAAKGALLYQLFATPRVGKLYTFPYRSRWIDADTKAPLAFPKNLGLDFVQKRASPKKSGRGNVGGSRPQPRWKIKKGTRMVCYFKLCAFRSMN